MIRKDTELTPEQQRELNAWQPKPHFSQKVGECSICRNGIFLWDDPPVKIWACDHYDPLH